MQLGCKPSAVRGSSGEGVAESPTLPAMMEMDCSLFQSLPFNGFVLESEVVC